MISVLGIDPAKDAGGAALLYPDGMSVERAWGFTRRTRKGTKFYEVKGSDGTIFEAPNLAAVGGYIFKSTPDVYALVVEGLFVGANKKESMALEWSAGLVASPMVSVCYGDVMRPTSMQWRPEIVGIPGNTAAKVAADMAIKWVASNLQGMGALSDNEHACEAACQALYGWRLINGKIA